MKLLCHIMLLLCLCSCAGVTFRKIGNDTSRDARDRGIRYYPPAPYLLVHTNNDDGLTSRVIFLPDTSRKMSARPYAVMAKNTTKLTFDESMHYLKGMSVDAGADEVPKAFVAALQTVAASAIKAGVGMNKVDSSRASVPAPSLFKIIVKDQEIQLIGGQGSPSIVHF